jgi:dipeptide/tripeptide permease
MGINIGAFICNIIAAFMRNKFGWGEAFITAGVGMLIGMVIFTIGRKHYIHAAQMKPVQEGDTKLSEILMKVFVPAIAAGAIGWFIPEIFLEVTVQMPLFSPVFLLFISMLPFTLKLNLMKKRRSEHYFRYS